MRTYSLGESDKFGQWPFLLGQHAFLADGTPLTECGEERRIIPARNIGNFTVKSCGGGSLSLSDQKRGIEALARALNDNDLARASILLVQLQIDPHLPLEKFNQNHRPAGPGGGQFTFNPNLVPVQGALPFPMLFPPPAVSNGPRRPRDDDYPLPLPGSDSGQSSLSNSTSRAYSANDNNPKQCPDASFEADSKKRTDDQLDYQAQINGLPRGYEVVLNGVGYDGCREEPSDSTMLEAKFVKPWFVSIPQDEFQTMNEYKETVAQAFRQNYSSGGRLVEWHFSDPLVAGYWRGEFERLRYENIRVFYTFYNKPFSNDAEKFEGTYLVKLFIGELRWDIR
jgi:hypothetical protein